MKVMFLTSEDRGLYSRMASGVSDIEYGMLYDIRDGGKFSALLKSVPMKGDKVDAIKDAIKKYGYAVVAIGFFDDHFVKTVMSEGMDVFIAPGKKRISDIIYIVGGG